MHKSCQNVAASFVNDFPQFDTKSAIAKHTAKEENPVLMGLRYFFVVFIGLVLSMALFVRIRGKMGKMRYRPSERLDSDDSSDDSDGDSDYSADGGYSSEGFSEQGSVDDSGSDYEEKRRRASPPLQLETIESALTTQLPAS